MTNNEEKDTFDSFLKKYRVYRDYFNKEMNMNIQDEIARFNVDSYSGRTLAVVILMLVHNKYANVSPNIVNIGRYDLKELMTVDKSMFEPYIAILRTGKKEKKASGDVTPAQRQARFVATFKRYLTVIRKLHIITTA